MPLYLWSETAANNGTADPTCPFPEGMAASALNDGARGLMAAVAAYRDDIAGSIVTASSGTNIAYVLSTNSGYDTLAHLNGQIIAFSPNVTNGAGPVTITIDGLGPLTVQPSPGVTLPAGTLIEGTPYVGLVNSAATAIYLMGSYGNPYNVPLGAGFDFWMPTAPNSAFAFPAGQAISRTVYATLFAGMGTTFGAGDGATTFNLPDKRSKVTIAADNMGGTAAGRTVLEFGASGGAATETLATDNLPPYTPTGSASGSISGTASSGLINTTALGGGGACEVPVVNGTSNLVNGGSLAVTGSFEGAVAMNAQGGTSAPFSLLQPTIACNYIIRII